MGRDTQLDTQEINIRKGTTPVTGFAAFPCGLKSPITGCAILDAVPDDNAQRAVLRTSTTSGLINIYVYRTPTTLGVAQVSTTEKSVTWVAW